MNFRNFRNASPTAGDFFGDLTAQQFGLAEDEQGLVEPTDSLIHCAASLNRKSEVQSLNVNSRTLK
jgi:thioester reductase-like protein